MDKQVYKDIKMLLNMIKKQSSTNKSDYLRILDWAKSSDKFSLMSPCYLYSNENLRSYYEKINMKDKNILTVTGSGDQVLSAILYGAKHIDTFDSNKLTYYNLMLKKYAVSALSYDEFRNFYFLTYDYNRLEQYKKISKCINEVEIKYFWDDFFSEHQEKFRYCFLSKDGSYHLVVRRIPYMDLNNYEILKKKIDDCSIIYNNLDIFNINDIYKNNYSFINLSNILDYISNKKCFIDLIKNIDKNKLEENGVILLNYYWSNSAYNSDKSNECVYNVFDASNLIIDDVAVNDFRQKGNAIMYTKKSK